MLGGYSFGGIEAVKRFAPEGCGSQVIYLAKSVEFCTKVYQTDHVYLLTKPVNQEELDAALNKALRNLERADSHPLAVHVGGSVFALQPQKISYVESDRRKVRIHQGHDVIEMYASLSDLAQRLPRTFVRCHKGFLVNMDHIAELQKTDVRLHSGELVPLSQRKRYEVREAFITHLQGRL